MCMQYKNFTWKPPYYKALKIFPFPFQTVDMGLEYSEIGEEREDHIRKATDRIRGL